MLKHVVKLIGTGAYLPGEPVKFEEISKVLGEITEAPPRIRNWLKNVEPILQDMLGIEQSYFAIDPKTREFTETNITMAVKAAKKAMDDARIGPEGIDLILFACASLEQMPPASTRIQEELGIKNCGEISIQSNCTSVYKAIMLAHDLISVGRYQTVMVVSSNMASSTAIAEFYNQKVVKREELFLRWFLCDGAGCMIFTRAEGPDSSGVFLEASYIESIGVGHEPMMYNSKEAYAMNPLKVWEKGLHHIAQKGTHQRDSGDHDQGSLLANSFVQGLARMSRRFEIDLQKTSYFNINFPARHVYDLVKEMCCALGVPKESYYAKMREFGYAGPPMVLITMDKLFKEEKLKVGDQIVSFVVEVSKLMQGGFVFQCY